MRKLALLTTMAIAALAMTATPAFADMEVRDSATGELCSDVLPAINKTNPLLGSAPAYQSGGCTVHVEPIEPTWVGPPSGGGQYCNLYYDLHIDSEGWGYANNFYYQSCPWQTTGTRRVLPGDLNLAGVHYYADQDTDFNIYLSAVWPGMGWTNSAGVSLDATGSDPLTLANQNPASEAFGGGIWEGDAGLDITHN